MELITLQIPGALFPSFPTLTPQGLMCSKSFKQETWGSLMLSVFASYFCKCSARELGTKYKLRQPREFRRLMPPL